MHIRAALLTFVLLTIAASKAPAQTAPSRLERVRFLGREYVRLQDWARANGFNASWLNRGRTLGLTKGQQRLEFSTDSREVEINGVKVWLSYPIAARGGTGYLSLLDLQSKVQPLVFPPRLPPGEKVRTIVLDPGHGGKDNGNSYGGLREKDLVLQLAQELRGQLSKAGFTVALTRNTDTFVELPDRPGIARRRDADVFLSLHFNATGSSRNSVRGSEVYCFTPAGATSTNARGEGAESRRSAGNRYDALNALLAWQMQKALTQQLGTEDRGVRRARFEVLRYATMPATLIEAGFLSHPAEGRRIADPAYRRQMARAITDALIAYRKAVER